jgi:hypothetical protein
MDTKVNVDTVWTQWREKQRGYWWEKLKDSDHM